MSGPRIEDYLGVDKYSAPQWLGERAVRRFHVMAKPAGRACNLDCTYCFYLSKQSPPGGRGGGPMSDETLERFVRDYIDRTVWLDHGVVRMDGETDHVVSSYLASGRDETLLETTPPKEAVPAL